MFANLRHAAVVLMFGATVSHGIVCAVSAADPTVSSSSNYDESKITPYTLPDLFVLNDGSKVTTTAVWESQRRGELLEIFRREMYGFSPPKPASLRFDLLHSDANATAGKATCKQIAIRFEVGDEKFMFPMTMFVPNAAKSPVPVFLLLNHRGPENTDSTRNKKSEFWPAEEVIARGYAIAAINVCADVEPDRPDATTGVRVSYREHAPEAAEFTWGAIAAWSWAGSRGVDYFETDSDINADQIVVVGHSRSGKAALWAAAQDTRFALACVNDAGEGGPALTRRNFGETIGQVTHNFPHWFVPRYATYAGRENTLPMDQHELIGLVAPRGYHGGDATKDAWADPRGSWLSLVEASKVWAMYGAAPQLKGEPPQVNELLTKNSIAYHIREGIHDLTAFDWKLYMDHADLLFQPPAVK